MNPLGLWLGISEYISSVRAGLYLKQETFDKYGNDKANYLVLKYPKLSGSLPKLMYQKDNATDTKRGKNK